MREYLRPNDVREARNFICKECGLIFRTPQGIMCHLRKTHNIKKVRHVKHWGITKRVADNFTRERI